MCLSEIHINLCVAEIRRQRLHLYDLYLQN